MVLVLPGGGKLRLSKSGWKVAPVVGTHLIRDI